MSKQNKLNNTILEQIKSGQLKMKPRWYFVVGSTLLFISLMIIFATTIFFTNIIIFMLKRHGSINFWRLDMLLGSIPIWIPTLVIAGLVLGIFLIKKYDFAYRYKFSHVVISLILAILLSSWIIDTLGFNDWASRRPMRRFYQNLDSTSYPRFYFNSYHMRGSKHRLH